MHHVLLTHIDMSPGLLKLFKQYEQLSRVQKSCRSNQFKSSGLVQMHQYRLTNVAFIIWAVCSTFTGYFHYSLDCTIYTLPPKKNRVVSTFKWTWNNNADDNKTKQKNRNKVKKATAKHKGEYTHSFRWGRDERIGLMSSHLHSVYDLHNVPIRLPLLYLNSQSEATFAFPWPYR